ncbi:MAG: ATP-dependent helicase [Planctomycetes bacterium]|nr:ATP-dependent helicase [Planctomycetota bacterium]
MQPFDVEKVDFATPGITVIDAAAGTGKTTQMVACFRKAVSDGIAVEQILGLTFTRKAAASLSDRVRRELGTRAKIGVSTYDAFWLSVVEHASESLGIQSFASLASDEESREIRRRAGSRLRKTHALDLLRLSQLSKLGIRDIANAADKLGSLHGSQGEARSSILASTDCGEARKITLTLIEAYIRFRAEISDDLGRTDYVGIQREAMRILADEGLSKEIRERHRAILLDEYQDTNRLQARLVMLLAGKNRARIVAVGDARQAIYQFRGGDDRQFTSLKERAEVFELSKNYRSFQPVLDVASFAVKLRTDSEDRIEATRGLPGEGFAGAIVARFPSKDQPCEFMCDRIRALMAEGFRIEAENKALRKPPGHKIVPGDIAVLCRNRYQVRDAARKLREAGIPCFAHGSNVLFGSLFVDALRLLLDAALRMARDEWIRVFAHPAFGVSDRVFVRLSSYRDHLEEDEGADSDERIVRTLLEYAVRECGFDDESILARLRDCADEWKAMVRETSVARSVRTIAEESGIRRVATSIGIEESKKLDEFIATASEFSAANPSLGISEFLEFIEEIENSEDARSADVTMNVVNVMTVHQAKGLEFPVVFVPFVADLVPGKLDGILFDDLRGAVVSGTPEYDELAADEEFVKMREREELNVFYVACTRAQDRLFLAGASNKLVKEAGGRRRSGRSGGRDFIDALFDYAKNAPGMEAIEGDAAFLRRPYKFEREFERVDASAFAEHIVKVLAPYDDTGAEREERKSDSAERTRINLHDLSAYSFCPHRYFLARTIARADAPPKRGYENPEIENGAGVAQDPRVFGTIVHDALYLAHRESVQARKGRTIELFETLARELSADERRRGRDILAKYEASEFFRQKVVGAEYAFTLRSGECELHGIIDRMHESEEGVVLADYKTYTPRGSRFEELRWQLSTYALALSELGFEVASAGAIVLLPENVSWLPVDVIDSGEVRAALSRTVRGIRESNFDPPANPPCAECPVREVCDLKVVSVHGLGPRTSRPQNPSGVLA